MKWYGQRYVQLPAQRRGKYVHAAAGGQGHDDPGELVRVLAMCGGEAGGEQGGNTGQGAATGRHERLSRRTGIHTHYGSACGAWDHSDMQDVRPRGGSHRAPSAHAKFVALTRRLI